MNIKISATHEGKCDVCDKKGMVFTVGDEDTHTAASICKECSQKMGSETLTSLIEKFGKKNDTIFAPGVKYEGKPTAG